MGIKKTINTGSALSEFLQWFAIIVGAIFLALYWFGGLDKTLKDYKNSFPPKKGDADYAQYEKCGIQLKELYAKIEIVAYYADKCKEAVLKNGKYSLHNNNMCSQYGKYVRSMSSPEAISLSDCSDVAI